MTDVNQKVYAVTGAQGYLGSRVVTYLRQQGHLVYELSRYRSENPVENPWQIPFSLESSANPFASKPVNCLIHCAYDFSKTQWNDIYRVNVEGSLKLFNLAQEAGVSNIIFISSMSAFDGCRSSYGKAKLQIEKAAEKLGITIVRPGLVFGGNSGGVFGSLSKLVAIAPIIPLVGLGNQPLYLVHEADLCRAIEQFSLRRDVIQAPIIAAEAKSHSLKQILQIIAAKKGKKPVFIPIPWQLIWVILKASEGIGLRLFRSDSLISLINQDPHPSFAMTQKVGGQFRDFCGDALEDG